MHTLTKVVFFTIIVTIIIIFIIIHDVADVKVGILIFLPVDSLVLEML